MKLLKKFKDYFSNKPKEAYSIYNITKKELDYIFTSLFDELDSIKVNPSATTLSNGESVHCISIECVLFDTHNFNEIAPIALKATKRFNGLFKDSGFLSDIKFVNTKRDSIEQLPFKLKLEELPKEIVEKRHFNFYILLYNPEGYCNQSAYKRGIKEKPTRGYAFFADYL